MIQTVVLHPHWFRDRNGIPRINEAARVMGRTVISVSINIESPRIMTDHKKIHESKYGDSPMNFHVSKHGDELSVTLTYPPWTDADNRNGQCRHIRINQEAVRASDGIRVHYDYTRDGFVVEQPRPFLVKKGETRNSISYESGETWIEVGFFQSWAFERSDEEQELEAEIAFQRKQKS